VLEAIAGEPVPVREAGEVRAPGTLASHYSPEARLLLVPPAEQAVRAAALRAQGRRVGVLAFEPGAAVDGATIVDLGASEEAAARRLYAAIRELDETCDVILAWPPDERGLGLAVADRLRRAATTD
jgi:L-threonylcarbamoyladenylate synthase